MKFRSFIACLLALVMCVAFVGCGNGSEGDATTPAAADTSAAPDDSSTAPAESSAAPADSSTAPAESSAVPAESSATPETSAPATTAAPETSAPADINALEGEKLAEYKLLLPAVLPGDIAEYTVDRAMCFDLADEEYTIEGNSGSKASWITVEEGAIWGKAVKFPAAGKNENNRGEITVNAFTGTNLRGAKGVLFYVDMSHATLKDGQHMCASVTVNNNKYRSTHGKAETAEAYYYDGTNWIQTTNKDNLNADGTTLGEACRLALPDLFKGWVYVPATSYWLTDSKDADGFYAEAAFADGVFNDIEVLNIRCYTDGYVFSYDSYIIFDEVLYIH